MLGRLMHLAYNRSAFHRHPTQVFRELTDQELATTPLVSNMIKKPVHMTQRTTTMNLFHGKQVRHKINTCFSEKKSKQFRKVNKIKRRYDSDLLGKNIQAKMSMKAYKEVKRFGSLDNYILCTDPKQLHSKYGEYLRELMLRKINNPDYQVPYVLRTKPVKRVKGYKASLNRKMINKVVIPQDFKKKFQTYQRKFGTSVDELNEEDYQKYLQLETLRRESTTELDPEHPLVKEIEEKLNPSVPEEQLEWLMSQRKQAEEDYLNQPKNNELRRQVH